MTVGDESDKTRAKPSNLWTGLRAGVPVLLSTEADRLKAQSRIAGQIRNGITTVSQTRKSRDST